MKYVLTILYVAEQAASCVFYKQILQMEPILDVPGMTEFKLNDGASLGLMPESGIAKILCHESDIDTELQSVPHPSSGSGIPRCELYLPVDNPDEWLKRLIKAGGKAISYAIPRGWGDVVAYGSDPDGHILAFAQSLIRYN